MPRRLHELTALQLRVLAVLWSSGEATATEVHARLEAETGLSRKTIGTVLFRLKKQGVVTHREDGREYVYRAAVTRDEVRQSMLGKVLGHLYAGEVPAMVSHVLEAGEVKPGDIERIRALLKEREAE